MVVQPATRVSGTIRVPGDKSISHRYALMAALATGRSTIHNYAPGGDCASTLQCLGGLGVSIQRTPQNTGTTVVIQGRGLRGLTAAPGTLDCGNSGSTMRMLAGVVAAHSFATTLVGDASLSRRPMRRVMDPLSKMGARIEASAGERPPLKIYGRDLDGIDYAPEVSSAQVKSAVLLAGLQARGPSRITERTPTRDHTERALAAFGAVVEQAGASVTLAGGQTLYGIEARVPGDISSAAFAMVAAAMLPGSDVTLEDVGLNPSRTAIVGVLRRFGVSIDSDQTAEWQHEPVGRIRIRTPKGPLGGEETRRDLRIVELGADIVPSIIDELPVLAALATAGGELRVTGAGELRVKESDRITSVVDGLRALGADAEELPDGFHIRGHRRLRGATVQAHDDHRLAMAFAIAGLTASGPVVIEGAQAAAVSYPSFFEDVERLRA